MDSSTPGSSVLHYLPEFAQIHVHSVISPHVSILFQILFPVRLLQSIEQHKMFFRRDRYALWCSTIILKRGWTQSAKPRWNASGGKCKEKKRRQHPSTRSPWAPSGQDASLLPSAENSLPPPLRVPTELSQRVLWVFEIGTCSSGFQKRLCFHLPRQLPPLPLLQPPRWMKHLAVFQGLSHLHPDPLQGITEVFAPQLSTPVGRLQERKKKNKKKTKNTSYFP